MSAEPDRENKPRSRGRPRKNPVDDTSDGARGGGVQSLERAAALLDAVAARPQGINLADLSAQVGLHTSTAFNLVKTMVSLGILQQAPETKRYRVGPRIFMLAAGALEENTLLAYSTPILERLSAATQEAAHLAIRSGHDIIVVARTAATGLLTLSDRTGALRPPHATAIGKTLMAAMSDDELGHMIGKIDKPQFTKATITEPNALMAEIQAVRAEGMAHDRGELDPEVRCIAVPVRDFAGRTIAAMGISGPVWHMGADAIAAKSEVLRASADELSTLLGGKTSGLGS